MIYASSPVGTKDERNRITSLLPCAVVPGFLPVCHIGVNWYARPGLLGLDAGLAVLGRTAGGNRAPHLPHLLGCIRAGDATGSSYFCTGSHKTRPFCSPACMAF